MKKDTRFRRENSKENLIAATEIHNLKEVHRHLIMGGIYKPKKIQKQT